MRLTRALTGFAAAVAVMAASVAAYAGTVVSQKFASPTLGRDWVYNVYLPDGCDTGKLRYRCTCSTATAATRTSGWPRARRRRRSTG